MLESKGLRTGFLHRPEDTSVQKCGNLVIEVRWKPRDEFPDGSFYLTQRAGQPQRAVGRQAIGNEYRNLTGVAFTHPPGRQFTDLTGKSRSKVGIVDLECRRRWAILLLPVAAQKPKEHRIIGHLDERRTRLAPQPPQQSLLPSAVQSTSSNQLAPTCCGQRPKEHRIIGHLDERRTRLAPQPPQQSLLPSAVQSTSSNQLAPTCCGQRQ